MARLKRDAKGRFLKRGKAKKARATPRKRKSGLKGHKPGCKCVIHARARRANPKRRARPTRARRAVARRARPARTHRARASKGPVAIRLSKAEASSFRKGGAAIRAKVQRRAASLLRTHSAVKVTGPTGATIAHVRR